MTSGRLRRFVGPARRLEFAQRGRRPDPGEACEMCGVDDRRRAPARRQPRARAACCAPAGRATCSSPRRVPAGATTARCPTATCRPGSQLTRGAVGRAAGARRRWPSSSTTACSAASSRTTRARPARPSRCSTCRRGTTIAACTPLAAALLPDVEALIVRRDRGQRRVYLVPIDACYELVGRLRMHWTGFDGGPEARRTSTAFFERVRAPVAAARRRVGDG